MRVMRVPRVIWELRSVLRVLEGEEYWIHLSDKEEETKLHRLGADLEYLGSRLKGETR